MNTKNENAEGGGGLNEDHSSMRSVVVVVLALWFGLIFVLGANGAFVARSGLPPLAIFLGFAIPLAVFFAAYAGWNRYRAFVLGADLRFLAAIQAWRWAGFGFLALYARGIVPGLFAFPAGLGDMAIGFTAPWIVMRLVRDPQFASSRRFIIWNFLGILDLVTAVSLGAICSGVFPGLTGNITTSAMAQLPLVFIPAYLVPLFIMLHLTAISQARRLARLGDFQPEKPLSHPIHQFSKA